MMSRAGVAVALLAVLSVLVASSVEARAYGDEDGVLQNVLLELGLNAPDGSASSDAAASSTSGATSASAASAAAAGPSQEALPSQDFQKNSNQEKDGIMDLNENLIATRTEGDHRPPPDPLNVDYTRAKIVLAQASEQGNKQFVLREKRMVAADLRGVAEEQRKENRASEEHAKFRQEHSQRKEHFESKIKTKETKFKNKLAERDDRSVAELKAAQAHAALETERALAAALIKDKNNKELADKIEKHEEDLLKKDIQRGNKKVQEMETKAKKEAEIEKERMRTWKQIEERKKAERKERLDRLDKDEEKFKGNKMAQWKKTQAEYKANEKKREEAIEKMRKEEIAEQNSDTKQSQKLRHWLEQSRKDLKRKMEAAKRTKVPGAR